ncbi:MAG: PAS domain S-box protein, partial [Vicingaceae bacterium]
MTKPQFNITDLKGQNSNSLFDNDRIIPLIKESGQNYLNQLVKYLSESANCKYAFVGLVAENETHVETKSFYANGSLAKDFIYNLKNTPCENVIKEKACLIKDSVQELYPKDKDLKDLGVESYIGVPLFDIERKPVGIVVLMDDEPFSDVLSTLWLIDILESKTELEIGRLKLKERLVLSRQGYKDVFDNFQDVFFIVYYNDKNEQIDLVMSPSAKKNLGYDLKELKALDFSSLFVRELEREIFYHHIKTEREIKGELHLMENKSGEKLYVEVDCKYIDDNLLPGAKYGIRGVLKDVTKKHKEKLRTEIAFLIAQKSERRLTSVKSLVEFIRQSLMNVVNVSNFYIAIHEKEKNNLFFPIVFDDDSGMLSDSEVRMPFQNSFTELIIRSKKSIIKNKEGLTRVIKTEELNPRGKLPEFYVGVPLKSEGKCFGAMVMQTYDKGDCYSKEDVDLFHFIGTQVAYIIERTLWQEELIKKEEHYRSLIENSSEIFGVVNRFGVVQYMSESTLKITGYSPLSFIGKNIKEIM